MTLCLTATSNARAACAESDLPCFRRGFLERGQQLDSLARELGLNDQLIANQAEQIKLQAGTIDAQKRALDVAKPALAAGGRSAFEAPALWLGLGVVLGIGLTVLSAWALSQVAR